MIEIGLLIVVILRLLPEILSENAVQVHAAAAGGYNPARTCLDREAATA